MRSHVTSQRYREKRERDIESYASKIHKSFGSPSITDKTTSPSESITASNYPDQTLVSYSTDALDNPVNSEYTTFINDEFSPLPTRPAYLPSSYSLLGSGVSNSAVLLPEIKYPRMSKHLYYCTKPLII